MGDIAAASGREPGLLFIAWLAVFAASFLAFVLIEPGDMGFTRGLNRLGPFLLAQAVAAVLAVVAWVRGRGTWLGRIPVMVTLAGIAMLVMAVVYAVATN